jgi:hypothetical protein
VTVCIGVREQSTLQHGVGRRLDSGWHVRRVERDLLDLGKVVLGVGVQCQYTDLSQRELLLGPSVCEVKLWRDN